MESPIIALLLLLIVLIIVLLSTNVDPTQKNTFSPRRCKEPPKANPNKSPASK